MTNVEGSARMTPQASGASAPPNAPIEQSARRNAAIEQFGQWLRHEFVERNTELEEAYFAARVEVLHDRPDLETIKRAIVLDGAKLIDQIVEDGQTPADPQARYELLGAVGFYLAACRRHEVDGPDHPHHESLAPAWSLATQLGGSLGVAPRYVFAHQALYNRAVGDIYQTFTALPDEYVFVTHNALGVLAYQRAANALRRILPLGVSSPMVEYLLDDARAALDDVLTFNRRLGTTLDPDRFFLNIRPYFKPHQVAGTEYRGVNAGDFAAINEIDLLLGLCSPQDPFYRRLVTEKSSYIPPDDQRLLAVAVAGGSLLEDFLREAEAGPVTPQLRANAERYLAVCRSHGAAYAYHHHKLVKPFLEEPAKRAPSDRQDDITASGPPLDVVIRMLGRLRDLRAARDRPDAPTARTSLDRLRDLTQPGS